MMMQAAKLFGANNIRVVTCPVPEIGDDEMLLKTGAASICGSDLRMIANGYRGVDAEHPLTLGHEFSGTIVAVGKNVSTYKVGMRVAIAPNMGCGVCAALRAIRISALIIRRSASTWTVALRSMCALSVQRFARVT